MIHKAMKMNILAFLLTVNLLTGFALFAQTSSVDEMSKRLESNNLEVAKASIEEAAANKNIGLLFVAMHNPNVEAQLFCLDKVSTLSIKDQSELLSRTLVDSAILYYADELQAGNAESGMRQMQLQERLQNMVHALLHDGKRAHRQFVTRPEAAELSRKLKELK